MATIHLDPPTEGTVINVPLGQSRVVTLSGSFSFEPAGGEPEFVVTLTGGAGTVAASVDAENLAFQAQVTLNSPSTNTLIAKLDVNIWIEAKGNKPGHWVKEHAVSDTLNITVQDATPDTEYFINCRCVDSANRVLVGIQIEAYDQDPKSPDDKLGATALTDVDGFALFHFHKSDFTEHPGERYPDVYFKLSQSGTTLTYALPGERNVNGVMRNFIPHPAPVIIHVAGIRGFIVQGAIRDKWLSLGAHTGFLGRPVSDETPAASEGGLFNHFEGGSIFWTAQWGVFEVHGPIRQKWSELGWEQGFLGFPVTDVLAIPDSGGQYSVFEHGIITLQPGQAEAVAEQHHYERIYAQIRAKILARFFAIGKQGRRNHFASANQLAGVVNTTDGKEKAEMARWSIDQSNDGNPFLYGSLLNIALAVEQDAGNVESARALESSLNSMISLCAWAEPGAEASARLPVRWDPGIPLNAQSAEKQFLDNGHGAYTISVPSTDIHHFFRRPLPIMEKLLGPIAAKAYIDKQNDYWGLYRLNEFSMDELSGLVTTCWAIGTLAKSDAITALVKSLSSLIGNYLADNGYLLVRPMRGLAYQGATGALPTLEFPFSRALGKVAGANFSARTDFKNAMIKAGYWSEIEGAVTAGEIEGGLLAALLPLLGPVAASLGLTVDTLEQMLAQQSLSPTTIGGAIGLAGMDVFDMHEKIEPAMALAFREAPNKAGLYTAAALGTATFGKFDAWYINFHGWLGLTGLDDPDPTMRDTFAAWFLLRQAQPYDKEPKGQGSRMIFTAGVRALLLSDGNSESLLVTRLEQAIVELFRGCYFDPQLPLKDSQTEVCWFGFRDYVANPNTPYSPLDFMAGLALAFWHAKRKTVSTPRFPQPLAADRFGAWPRATVPEYCKSVFADMKIPLESIQGTPDPVAEADGYPLFNLPLVERNASPSPQHSWTQANRQVCDFVINVHAMDAGDVPTGVTLHPGCEIQIDASGSIWSGGVFDPSNDPDGLDRLINDPTWPLHTAIDPVAKAFCLVGRLNGYFRIGKSLARTAWVYYESRPLFLRINDGQPGDGNGQFDVRIQVWAPDEINAADVFRPFNVLQDGGVLRTQEAADLIEVTITRAAVPTDQVEFVLNTPGNITWRKEIVIQESPATGTGVWTIATQDAFHTDANGLYLYQLPGANLTFRKDKGVFGGGMRTVAALSGLNVITPGARVTFSWVFD
jgi:hypothetical protein